MNIGEKPQPNPELKKLDRLVGTWNVSGDTCGLVSFSWMEGGFFLVQYIELSDVKGLEFIGYDERSATLRSHYFDNDGKVFEHTYKINETDHIVSINMPAVKGQFDGKFSDNGTTITGQWYLKQDGKEMRYNAVLIKMP
jgi:hypothetical protein